MTVPSEINRSGPYNGNGVTTSFPYEFRILSDQHVRVISRDLVSGVEVVLVRGVDYSVSGVGAVGGGAIVLSSALPLGLSLTVLRAVPFTQETDLENQGAYYAETVEEALDLAAMRDQQLMEMLNRAVKVPEGSDAGEGSLSEELATGIVRLAQSADNIDAVAGSIQDVEAVSDAVDEVKVVAQNIDALKNASGSVLNLADGSYIAEAGQDTFDLPAYANADENVILWVNGVRQVPGADYSVFGEYLELVTPLSAGDTVDLLVVSAVSFSEVNALYEEVQKAALFRVQLIKTVAGQRVYSVDAEGNPINLPRDAFMVIGSSPFGGGVSPRVDVTSTDAGALQFLFDPEDDELFTALSFPRVSNAEAQAVVSELLQARDEAVAVGKGNTSRAELASLIGGGWTPESGKTYFGDGLSYTADPAASMLPGLPGMKPAGVVEVGHFGGDLSAAAAYVARPRTDYTPSVVLPKVLITDTGWNPVSDPVYGRTEGQSALAHLGGHYDYLGAPSRAYLWGYQAWLSNTESAGVTAGDFTGQGWLVRGVGATARQIGAGGDAHAIEVIIGQYNATGRFRARVGDPRMDVVDSLRHGSRFCIGDRITGNSVPVGATIVGLEKNGRVMTGAQCLREILASGGSGYQVGDVLTLQGGTRDYPAQFAVRSVGTGGSLSTVSVTDAGSYSVLPGALAFTGGSGTGGALSGASWIPAGLGFPSHVIISAPCEGAGLTNVTVISTEATQNVGLLVTGSGDGSPDQTGNQNGRGIALQAYGTAQFRYGMTIGQSALRPTDGVGIGFVSSPGDKGIEFTSCTMNYAFRINGGTWANSLIEFNALTATSAGISFSNVTAQFGIRFTSSNAFTNGALYLQGQTIDTDTVLGMRIGGGATRKLGFWGATPVARPAAIPNAAAGTEVATINAILAALRTAGIIAT